MAGSISDYLENKLLDHVLKVASFSQPTNLYIALSTADPTDDGSGLAEPSGNGYARQLCNAWDTAASRATQNTNKVSFPEATGSWGTITHWAIMDAETGGNMIAHGDFTESKTVGAGDNVNIAAGDLDISVTSGGMSDYLANKLLDHVFKNDAYAVPTNIYVAACTATIVDSDTGSTITEPVGGAYARENCNTWDAAASGASQNANAITFTTATASWGTITDACLVDADTGGNMLFYMALDESQAVGVDDTLKFNTGGFDITMD